MSRVCVGPHKNAKQRKTCVSFLPSLPAHIITPPITTGWQIIRLQLRQMKYFSDSHILFKVCVRVCLRNPSHWGVDTQTSLSIVSCTKCEKLNQEKFILVCSGHEGAWQLMIVRGLPWLDGFSSLCAFQTRRIYIVLTLRWFSPTLSIRIRLYSLPFLSHISCFSCLVLSCPPLLVTLGSQ